MNELLTSVFNFVTEGGIDFASLGMFLVGYIVVLWIAFCIWVFVDARRRYRNYLVAIVITIFVFIGNFPALILYMVVRPEEDYDHHHGVYGGVEVPIMRFVGENGEVQMSLNLNVNSKLVEKADMSLDLGLSTDRSDIEMKEAETGARKDDASDAASRLSSMKSVFGKLKSGVNKVKPGKKKDTAKPKKEKSKKDTDVVEKKDDSNDEVDMTNDSEE